MRHLILLGAVLGSAVVPGCGEDAAAPADAETPVDADGTPPQLVFAMPADGAVEVATDAIITVFFDKLIDPSTVTTASFSLEDDLGTAVTGTVAAWPTGAVFKPGSALLVDRTYDATLTTAVRDLDGNPLAAATWSFATHRRSWSVPAILDDGSLLAAYPRVAVDGAGNAIAVWQQHDGSRFNIHASRFTAGSGWNDATQIETDNVGPAQLPQVAVDGAGNAIAVWNQGDGTRTNIYASRFVVGTGWGNPVLIETTNAGNADDAQLAVNSDGDAVAVWRQSDGSRNSIWTNRFIAEGFGSGWGTAALLEIDDAGEAGAAKVSIDDAGNAVAVWTQSDGTHYNTYANRLVAGTAWGSAVLLETDNAGIANNPEVAMNSAGNAVAVWSQFDGTRVNTYANRFVGTSWDGAMLIETDNTGPVYRPEVAVDAAGNAIAVWSQSDGTRYSIHANRFMVGTGWGTAALIETHDANDASGVDVTVDDAGNAVAVWSQFDGTRSNLWANRFVVGTGWGTATLVETDNTSHAENSHVASNGAGDVFAVWGTGGNMWGTAYR